jgi:DNA-binding PadR family transcriptional regulator
MKARESVEHLLLGALMAGPKHGYEIMQFLEQCLDMAWYISTSQLYTVLKRVERKQWVVSQIEIQDARPAKRVFALSPAGRAHFLAWLREPVRHVRDMRIEFIGKLFFAGYLNQAEMSRLIDSQEKILVATHASLGAKLAKEMNPFKKLLLSSKLHSVEAWHCWLTDSASPYAEAGGTGRK